MQAARCPFAVPSAAFSEDLPHLFPQDFNTALCKSTTCISFEQHSLGVFEDTWTLMPEGDTLQMLDSFYNPILLLVFKIYACLFLGRGLAYVKLSFSNLARFPWRNILIRTFCK